MMSTTKEVHLDVARRQIGELRAELRFQESHRKTIPSDIEAAYEKLLAATGHARLALLQLSTCLEGSGDDPGGSVEVNTLIGLIHEAGLLGLRLYESFIPAAKWRSLKAYEDSVTTLIEKGKGPHYMKTVTKSEILSQGEEVNRLYQILIEGKTATFRVDAVTLKNAAERTDLFSERQCSQLLKRSKEVHALMLQETERLVSQIERQESFELCKIDLEATSRSDRTDDTALFNSSVWACTECTFRNDQLSVHCAACGVKQKLDFVTVAKRKPIKERRTSDINNNCNKLPTKAKQSDNANKRIISLPLIDVPELIGPSGKHVEELKRETGASEIHAYDDHAQNGRCPVQIQGAPVAVGAAVAAIEQKFRLLACQDPEEKNFFPGMENLEKEKVVHVVLQMANAAIPTLIGPNGKSIKALIKETGVSTIYADQTRLNKFDWCPIDIVGHPDKVQAAKTVIHERFASSLMLSKIVWIANSSVPSFIGPAGRHVKALKRQTRIEYITADQSKVVQGLCPIRIEGNIDAVENAAANIISRFCGNFGGQQDDEGTCKSSEVYVSQDHFPGNGSTENSTIDVADSQQICSSIDKLMFNHNEGGDLQFEDESHEHIVAIAMAGLPSSSHYPISSVSFGLFTSNEALDTRPSSARYHLVSAIVKDDEANTDSLVEFLQKHKSSFKCPVVSFHNWLQSVDIESLEDFAEAMADDEFVEENMKPHGFKVFKRKAILRDAQTKVQCAIAKTARVKPPPGLWVAGLSDSFISSAPDPDSELVCPIRHVLFQDPVLAADGHCYEREAIESWFQTAESQGYPLLSPITQEPLRDKTLLPNILIANKARAFRRNNPSYGE
jgi:U-box domain